MERARHRLFLRVAGVRLVALMGALVLPALAWAQAAPITVGGFTFGAGESAFATDAWLVSGSVRSNCAAAGGTAAGSVAEALRGSDVVQCVNSTTSEGGIVEVLFTDHFIVNGPGPDLVIFELSGPQPTGTPDPRERFGVSVHYDDAFSPFSQFDPVATGFNSGPDPTLDIFAVEVDLTAFGVPDGSAVNRLQLHIFNVGLGTKSADVAALGALNAAALDGGDTTPPILLDVTITPGTFDTTSGSVSVTICAKADDPESGFLGFDAKLFALPASDPNSPDATVGASSNPLVVVPGPRAFCSIAVLGGQGRSVTYGAEVSVSNGAGLAGGSTSTTVARHPLLGLDAGVEDLCAIGDCEATDLATLAQCESELATCLATGGPDSDGDGEPDVTDLCPGSTSTEVDSAGCDLDQFCSAIDVTTRSGKRICRRSDWRNDEPLSRPHDCTLDRAGTLRREDDRCLPQ